MFPLPENNDGKITSFALGKHYLAYSTEVSYFRIQFFILVYFCCNFYLYFYFKSGNIYHFFIDEWQIVDKFKHDTSVKKIFPEPFGMSLALIDQKNEGYIYNPINNNKSIIKIPDLSPTTIGIVWESYESEKVTDTINSIVLIGFTKYY
jgi:hypothetical protein